ncbi:MAG: hypothetical protein AB7O04_00215 [Hyphomonadaceae bacterium]
MPSKSARYSDINDRLQKVDFSKLAVRFNAPAKSLETALKKIADFYDTQPISVRVATKQKLRGVARQIANIGRLLEERDVDTRLMLTLIRAENLRYGDDIALLKAFNRNRERINDALKSLGCLHEIVAQAELENLSPGRSSFDDWHFAGETLKIYWVDALGRKPTISGHREDGRNVRPSAFLTFVSVCFREIGIPLTEQGCRTMLLSLKKRNWDSLDRRGAA